jgi:uncharacterized membrane protein
VAGPQSPGGKDRKSLFDCMGFEEHNPLESHSVVTCLASRSSGVTKPKGKIMAYCSGCGQELVSGAAFCAKCGAPTGAAVTAAPDSDQASPAAGSGLQENVAGLLCYVLGWVTGLVFILIDKRPFVRFHAFQSIITFGGLHLLSVILTMVGFAGGFGGMMGGHVAWSFAWFVLSIVNLAALIAWIMCMVKSYQGQRFKLPVIGDMAENYSR